MTPERWQEIRRVLEAALDLEPQDRAVFLDSECAEDPGLRAEVEGMLASYEKSSSLLETPAIRLGGGAADPSETDSLTEPAVSGSDMPSRVGRYRLVETLGQGGMGEVFLAHRIDDYEQEVAIKLLRPGRQNEELLLRFLRERQILAGMEHPNIAKLLDGGTTEDGRPYLVMEYIQGEPFDAYCDREDLTVEQRLSLFVEVCDAIQFAHQNLVVHRDLKPGNILVTAEGRPKLLDFGIAKILRPEEFPQTVVPTRTGLTPMTPEYAAPEQIRGRAVTTATDVYALGVLLYEVLAGRKPFALSGGDFGKLVQDICHREPSRPSTVVLKPPPTESSTEAAEDASRRSKDYLRRRLAGDLDAIVLRALSKEPGDRYASAAQMRDDIQRHLDGLPVLARTGSLLYYAGKLIRRHRAGVSVALVAALSLAAFLATVFAQQRRLLEEQSLRLVQRDRAETVSSWMLELFELPAPSRSRGEKITVRELLDRNAATLAAQGKGDLRLQAELTGTIGRTYAQLGLSQEGIDLLRRSVSLHRQAGASEERPDEAALGTRLHQLADALTSFGDFRRAIVVGREALARRTTAEQEVGSAAVAQSLGLLGHLEDLQGNYERADSLLDEALALAREAGDESVLAKILDYSAEAHWSAGEFEAALPLYREALVLLVELHGELDPDVALMEANLAWAEATEHPQRAESRLRESIADQRKVFEDAHPVLATSLNNLGLVLYDTSRFEEAEAVLQEAADMQRELFGAGHPKVARTLSNLANAQAALGKLDSAEQHLRAALEVVERRLGADHADYGLCLNNLAELYLRRGDAERALPLLEQSQAVLEAALGREHPRLTEVLSSRGQAERLLGRRVEAERMLARAVDIADRSSGDQHPVLPAALYNLAVVRTELGKEEEAVRALERNLELVGRRGENLVSVAEIETRLADLLLKLGRFEEAESVGRRAHSSWLALAGNSNLWTLSVQGTLGLAILRQGRADEAEPLLVERLELLQAGQPAGSKRLRRAYEYVIELYRALDDVASAERYARELAALPGSDKMSP